MGWRSPRGNGNLRSACSAGFMLGTAGFGATPGVPPTLPVGSTGGTAPGAGASAAGGASAGGATATGGGAMGGGATTGGGGGGGGDSISLSISGSPEELEKGFQLAYLLLTEPRIEPAAFEQYQTSTRQMLQEVLRSPQALGGRTLAAAIYPEGEPRTSRLMRWLYGESQVDQPLQVIFVPGDDTPANLAAANRQAIDWAKKMFPEADSLRVEFAYPKAAGQVDAQTARASSNNDAVKLSDRFYP